MKKYVCLSMVLSLLVLVCSIALHCVSSKFVFPNYIDVMATFIGICATFIVGFQIYNSIEVKNQMKKLDEKIEKIEDKTNTLNKQIEEAKNVKEVMEKEIDNLKEEIESFKVWTFDNKIQKSLERENYLNAIDLWLRRIILFYNNEDNIWNKKYDITRTIYDIMNNDGKIVDIYLLDVIKKADWKPSDEADKWYINNIKSKLEKEIPQKNIKIDNINNVINLIRQKLGMPEFK